MENHQNPDFFHEQQPDYQEIDLNSKFKPSNDQYTEFNNRECISTNILQQIIAHLLKGSQIVECSFSANVLQKEIFRKTYSRNHQITTVEVHQ